MNVKWFVLSSEKVDNVGFLIQILRKRKRVIIRFMQSANEQTKTKTKKEDQPKITFNRWKWRDTCYEKETTNSDNKESQATTTPKQQFNKIKVVILLHIRGKRDGVRELWEFLATDKMKQINKVRNCEQQLQSSRNTKQSREDEKEQEKQINK